MPQRNGPLRVRDNLAICSGTGRTIKRTTGDALPHEGKLAAACKCNREALTKSLELVPRHCFSR
jgi:hypothetical protein